MRQIRNPQSQHPLIPVWEVGGRAIRNPREMRDLSGGVGTHPCLAGAAENGLLDLVGRAAGASQRRARRRGAQPGSRNGPEASAKAPDGRAYRSGEKDSLAIQSRPRDRVEVALL